MNREETLKNWVVWSLRIVKALNPLTELNVLTRLAAYLVNVWSGHTCLSERRAAKEYIGGTENLENSIKNKV